MKRWLKTWWAVALSAAISVAGLAYVASVEHAIRHDYPKTCRCVCQ